MDYSETELEREGILDCHWLAENTGPSPVQGKDMMWKGIVLASILSFTFWSSIALLLFL